MVIASVPMSKLLKQNETYTSSFRPKTGYKWAIVNGQDWHTDWEVLDDGLYPMKIVPQTLGKLSLFVQLSESEGFWPCLEYEVQ